MRRKRSFERLPCGHNASRGPVPNDVRRRSATAGSAFVPAVHRRPTSAPRAPGPAGPANARVRKTARFRSSPQKGVGGISRRGTCMAFGGSRASPAARAEMRGAAAFRAVRGMATRAVTTASVPGARGFNNIVAASRPLGRHRLHPRLGVFSAWTPTRGVAASAASSGEFGAPPRIVSGGGSRGKGKGGVVWVPSTAGVGGSARGRAFETTAGAGAGAGAPAPPPPQQRQFAQQQQQFAQQHAQQQQQHAQQQQQQHHHHHHHQQQLASLLILKRNKLRKHQEISRRLLTTLCTCSAACTVGLQQLNPKRPPRSERSG